MCMLYVCDVCINYVHIMMCVYVMHVCDVCMVGVSAMCVYNSL